MTNWWQIGILPDVRVDKAGMSPESRYQRAIFGLPFLKLTLAYASTEGLEHVMSLERLESLWISLNVHIEALEDRSKRRLHA